MRFTRILATAWAGIVAACGSLPGTQSAPGAGTPGVQPASVAGTEPSGRARSWEDYKLRAARRIHETSRGETFAGDLPDPLQSIPVLQVQLDRDGAVRNIVVLRTPGQSPETVQMAIRAIRRAAPFGPVGHLPRPWQFNETFLYNADLKFQLRTLAEAR
ncbi:MAG: energy transducer TonB [Ramlibacter sp.]